MRKLIEITHVGLGGVIGPTLDWAMPYLGAEHEAYAQEQLFKADALLLGRRTYEGLSAAYLVMPSTRFVDRMNSIKKYVASRTRQEFGWNASLIQGNVAEFVTKLKREGGGPLIKYGNGSLDAELMAERLIDEFHLLLTPVAVAGGEHIFEHMRHPQALQLAEVKRFGNGVVLLIYTL